MFGAAGPTATNPPQRHAAAGRDRQTDGRTPDSYIDYAGSANKSVFSFLRQLTTWHCPHLLLRAVEESNRMTEDRDK